MQKNNVIAIGCFYQVEVPASDKLIHAIFEDVLIGCIFSKVETEGSRNEALIARIDLPRWNRQSWLDRIREMFSCGNLILS